MPYRCPVQCLQQKASISLLSLYSTPFTWMMFLSKLMPFSSLISCSNCCSWAGPLCPRTLTATSCTPFLRPRYTCSQQGNSVRRL